MGLSCRCAAAASLLLASASATVLSSEIDPLKDLSTRLQWAVPGSAMTFDVSACVPRARAWSEARVAHGRERAP